MRQSRSGTNINAFILFLHKDKPPKTTSQNANKAIAFYEKVIFKCTYIYFREQHLILFISVRSPSSFQHILPIFLNLINKRCRYVKG